MNNAETKSKPDGLNRARVYKLVRQIPRGKVMTYGQFAIILGQGYTQRTVGVVMHGADADTQWHRVINSQGRCSTGGVVLPADMQQRMLGVEGVKFIGGKCDLEVFLWRPRLKKTRKAETAKGRAALYRR